FYRIKKEEEENRRNKKEITTKFDEEPAAQLLKQGEYTIAEITDMVGFSDAKYFREVFKKYYGVSPSKYGESEKTGSYPAINLKNEK
ncbi:AraC family transcriptional regulator, partial [Bacteroides xylanisolvens]